MDSDNESLIIDRNLADAINRIGHGLQDLVKEVRSSTDRLIKVEAKLDRDMEVEENLKKLEAAFQAQAVEMATFKAQTKTVGTIAVIAVPVIVQLISRLLQ